MDSPVRTSCLQLDELGLSRADPYVDFILVFVVFYLEPSELKLHAFFESPVGGVVHIEVTDASSVFE